MRRTRRWALWIGLALLAWLGWRYWKAGDADRHDDRGSVTREDPSLILNRVWMEDRPDRHKPTHHLHAMVMIHSQPVGVFQAASRYQGRFELFEFRRSGDKGRKVEVRFPQSGRTASFSYSIARCDDVPPFDLCLELSSNPWNGPRRYYGMERRRAGSGEVEVEIDALEARLLDQVPTR